ncbi:hypothetical protein L6164_031033 [Bauhinia variegata]|uniref:Uncharacterized protein n=1 Tax=Bauhinia variegata TaxID=167791 RepID=A0ACB9LEJ6_BAUVA|nr:hypothetical protein L6164_031033 [Bauhinia variegata]
MSALDNCESTLLFSADFSFLLNYVPSFTELKSWHNLIWNFLLLSTLIEKDVVDNLIMNFVSIRLLLLCMVAESFDSTDKNAMLLMFHVRLLFFSLLPNLPMVLSLHLRILVLLCGPLKQARATILDLLRYYN